MKYFPLTGDTFQHQFGVRAIPADESVVEATEHYTSEIHEKRLQLKGNPERYFAADADSVAVQKMAVDYLCHSASFLSDQSNQLTGEQFEIDDQHPLLSISRHLQEDLTIVSGDSITGFALVAGSVCFPSGWSIADKIGQPMLSIHQGVPEYATALHAATERLLNAIRVHRPVWRMNWGVRPTPQLDQSPWHLPAVHAERAKVTRENAGQRCFFRVERQTLARIPGSADVLFAIHTHQCSLSELTREQQCVLLSVLKTCPDETLSYKGILLMRDPLVRYLDQRSETS